MDLITVNINSKQLLSLRLDDYQQVRLGFTLTSGEFIGEFQCSVTPNNDTGHRTLKTVKIFSGDTIKISNKAESIVEGCFPEDKKNQLKEAYKKTNTGNPCKSHLHISVDNKDRYIVFGANSMDILFDYIWLLGKKTNEFSVGNISSSGNEQWMKALISPEHFIELLFLSNFK